MTTKREARKIVNGALKEHNLRIQMMESDLAHAQFQRAELLTFKDQLAASGKVGEDDLQWIIDQALEIQEGEIERTF